MSAPSVRRGRPRTGGGLGTVWLSGSGRGPDRMGPNALLLRSSRAGLLTSGCPALSVSRRLNTDEGVAHDPSFGGSAWGISGQSWLLVAVGRHSAERCPLVSIRFGRFTGAAAAAALLGPRRPVGDVRAGREAWMATRSELRRTRRRLRAAWEQYVQSDDRARPRTVGLTGRDRDKLGPVGGQGSACVVGGARRRS
jgi:hypothetical protein